MHREYRAGRFRKSLCVSPEVVRGDVGEGVHAEIDEVLGLFGKGQEASFRLSSAWHWVASTVERAA